MGNIRSFDSIVIGSGQGGNPLAQKLTERGERVALIERKFLGGTCINTGCTPTKTYVASAQVAHYVRNADRWGIKGSEPQVDMMAVMRRKQVLVERMRNGWQKTFEGNQNLTLFRGSARFVEPKTIAVDEERLSGKRIFIDTGGRPSIPKLGGLDSVPYLTNETILELNQIPKRLLILGAGYIGLEFSQIFRRFGSEVIVIGNASQILPNEDQDVAEELQKALGAEGIVFHLNTKASSVASEGPNSITVHAEDGESFSGSHLLLAVGRTPNTDELNAGAAGIELTARGHIKVNERLETTAPEVWALGDVTGGPAFTHISYNDYQIVYGNLFESERLSTRDRLVPYSVFTDPQLGRVGITEKQARESGKPIKLGKVMMTRVARAIERAETAGVMKIVIDAETDQVLGAALLAVEGGELVQILSTLMLAKQPYTLLKGAIYIHPTLAEGFFALMDSVR